MIGRGAIAGFVFSLTLYFMACWLPAIYVDDGVSSSSDLGFKDGSPIGLLILLFGYSGGNNGIPWSANVFLAVGIICLLNRSIRLAAVWSSVASLLGLTTWWVWGYKSLLIGYYLWQASLIVFAVGACWTVFGK